MKQKMWHRLLLGILFAGTCFPVFAAPHIQARAKETAAIELVWLTPDSREVPQASSPKVQQVLSPCWLEIVNARGDIESHLDVNQIRRAHEQGRKMWPLITNSFDAELTHELLQKPLARRHVVQQLLELCQKNDLDGINIDFENIKKADQEDLTEFIAELAEPLRAAGKTVSVDVTLPQDTTWGAAYDHAALAESIDYLALMAYDEHTKYSATSGSVSSFPWMEQGVQETIRRGVPASKILLGMPLYMRLWTEHKGKINASTLSMPAAEELWQKKHLTRSWLPLPGQYYFTYTEKGKTFKVWQENARSLSLKGSLVNRYNLAGIALWRAGFETPDAWTALEHTLDDGK